MNIEQVQVDCRELTKEQILRMYQIVEKKGYKKAEIDAYLVDNITYMFRKWDNINDKDFNVYMQNDNYKTITFDQFIAEFDDQPKSESPRLEMLIDLAKKEAQRLGMKIEIVFKS